MGALHIGYDHYMSLCITCITTLFSANVAVFTLTIAFLLNKKDALKLILKQINEGGISLTLSGKYNAAKEYVRKMKYITTVAMVGVILSSIGGIAYLTFICMPHTYWALIILVPILMSTICCGISLYKLFYWYFKG